MSVERRDLIQRILPEGLPALWCPPITHYDRHGAIDRARTEAHLNRIAPHVGGLLLAGSTGDGWDLSQELHREVVTRGLAAAKRHSLSVLVGVLRPNAHDASREIIRLARELTGAADGFSATSLLSARGICGFTVCPPVGVEKDPEALSDGLRALFRTGVPLALYQLPQVTGYELTPAQVSNLAAAYSNFVFFKDSSGRDVVASCDPLPEDIFLMRGAEGNYSHWLSISGGPYHGLLLSSANCFARELASIVLDLKQGRIEAARGMSARITLLMNDLFEVVSRMTVGNPFANANKAADHFMAFGPKAESTESPQLTGGEVMPRDIVRLSGDILERHGFLPQKGYLE